MKLNRKHRIMTAVLALVSLLFMQITVAAHACPNLSGAPMTTDGAAAPSMAGMATCDHMEQGQANVCHEHCHASVQVADRTAHAGPDMPSRDLHLFAVVPSVSPLPARYSLATVRHRKFDAGPGASPSSQRLRVLRI